MWPDPFCCCDCAILCNAETENRVRPCDTKPPHALCVSCLSAAALVGDLGHLTIKNNFLCVKDDLGDQLTTEGGIPAVVDEMKVSIESAKLSR